MIKKIKLILLFLPSIPVVLCYLLKKQDTRHRIMMDIERNEKMLKTPTKGPNLLRVYINLVTNGCFRAIYYMRIGRLQHFVSWLLRAPATCGVGSTLDKNFGGGIYIQHGWGMVVDAESVGENLWVNQNVTVGYRGDGHPRIGNNVRIGSGANVLGNISVGDNVNIGAGAVVVKDVPSNCTVVGNPAYICKLNGEKVKIEL